MAEEILSKSFSHIFSLFDSPVPDDPALSKFLSALESSLNSLKLPLNHSPSSITKQIKDLITESVNETVILKPSTLPSANLFTMSQLKRLNLI